VLLALGVAIGSRIESHRPATTIATVTVESSAAKSQARRPAPPSRTTAVAAAADAITAFDGNVLLEPERLRTVVAEIASTESRAELMATFAAASAQTRAKLGADTVPAPVIVLRSVPIGYRVERYKPGRAVVAVWYVGIVGSGATVQPQQSWRTETVSLVWENGAWKVDSFQSSDGPTPPLSTAEAPATVAQLFTAIPRFKEFTPK